MLMSKEKKNKNNRKIIKVGNFSPSNHYGKNVYSVDGLCPTLCSGSVVKNGLNIMEKNDNRRINKLGSTNGHQSGAVYSADGLCPTLCSVDYKSPLKILISDNMDKKEIIEKHFSKVDENRKMTTTKDGDALCLSTTRPQRPLGKKLTNYVLEKHFTQIDEHRAITTDKEKNTFCINTRPRTLPLPKKTDNYVLEEDTPLKLRETTKKGYKEAYPNDGVLTNRGNRKIAKGIVREQESGCLQTAGVWGTVTNDYRIRKLTPKECERLQGFPDDWTKWGADGEEISDTQRYKCCGNAVTTTVITAIVNEMFDGVEKNGV